MIRSLLRAPRGAEVVADALRVLSAIGIIVAFIGWGPLDAITITFATVGTLLPRLLGVRPFLDIATCIVIPMAAWSSVLEVYLTTRWWDIPMHFATNGITAALLYIFLVQLKVLADASELPYPALSTTLVTTALGLSLGVIWEWLEWFVLTFIDPEVFVSYADSLGDLVVGGLGALAAGLSMRYLAAGSLEVEIATDTEGEAVEGSGSPESTESTESTR